MLKIGYLNTNTDVTRTDDSLKIFTYFVTVTKGFNAFFATSTNYINGKFFKENELGFVNKGYDDIDIFINSDGELIVKSNTDKNFTINDDGELIMEEPD